MQRWVRELGWWARVGIVAVPVVVAAILALSAMDTDPALAEVQSATSDQQLYEMLSGADLESIDRAFVLDSVAFAPLYTAGLILGIVLLGRGKPLHRRRYIVPAVAVALGAMIADMVENGYALNAVAATSDGANLIETAREMHLAQNTKWAFLLLVGLYLIARGVQAPRPRWTNRPRAGERTASPPGVDWTMPSEPRVGIAVSGGGVRSASFALGALQRLDAVEGLGRVSVITAASGGGYTAAGWAVAASRAGPDADPPVYSARSPEEEWLRDHTYLIPNLRVGAAGVARLLLGLGINLVIVWLVLFTVARPIGWLVSIPALHPELRLGSSGKVSIDAWMWVAALVPAALSVVLFTARVVARPSTHGLTAIWNAAIRSLATLGVALFALLIAVPWLVQEVPDLFADLLVGDGLGVATGLVGFVALGAGTLWAHLKGPLSSAVRHRPLVVARVAISAVFVVGVALLFINLVDVAAANGPLGTFTGLGIDGRLDIVDWQKWAAVVLGLSLWNRVAPAHSWSLVPFYKRRLNDTYFFDRAANGSLDYATETSWCEYGSFGSDGPSLVLCCAANLYGSGEVPPGRNAGSFTFSSEVVGGPEVGWLPTHEYRHRADARRKDLTILSSVAMSGAALGPGMGSQSKGSIDSLLGVLNARLGTWLPNPALVAELEPGEHWRDVPGWGWLMRELGGRFRVDGEYVYVSDGGHWDNTGLVEVLRRGCNHVYIVSAAGDGADDFTTFGDAVALVREELGLEISVDLDPLFSSDGRPGAPFAVGSIARDGSSVGRVVLLEAARLDDMPVDIETYAKDHPEFPDDSTLDQFFSHRQFEAYRRLGEHQMELVLEEVPVP